MYRNCLACVRVSLLGLVVLAFGIPASAQTPSGDISVGYRFLRVASGVDENLPGGWYVDGAANVTDAIGIVGEFGGNYKSDFFGSGETLKLHTYAAGVRVTARQNPAAQPYGQVLFGGATASFFGESETDPIVQVGGGVDLATNAAVGVRVGVDYIRDFGGEGDEDTNVVRFAVGAIIPFGR